MLAETGLHLAPRMVELHPDLRAMSLADARPLAEFIQLPLIFQHHAARAGHGAAIDHHIAGQQQANATLGPGLIQAQQLGRRPLLQIGHVLFHRRFGNAIGKGAAVGQVQRLKSLHDVLRGSRWRKPKVKVNFKVNSRSADHEDW